MKDFTVQRNGHSRYNPRFACTVQGMDATKHKKSLNISLWIYIFKFGFTVSWYIRKL